MHPTDAAIQKFFYFKGRNRNLPWYPRNGTRNNLAELLGSLGFTFGAEIGTQRGLFSKVLFEGIPNLSLTCVDPWAEYYAASQQRQDAIYDLAVKNLQGLNVTFLRKPSLEGVKEFADETLDFVYIDGDHLFDAVVQDIIAWMPKIKLGGIMALHDYHTEVGADVMMAINAYTHCHDIRPWYVTREQLPSAYWVKK